MKTIVAIAFTLILLVSAIGAIPVQAQSIQLFRGQIYSFGGAFWTDGGSTIISSTLDNEYRRTQEITYHVKGTAGNVFVDGGPTLNLVFWPNTFGEVQHIYYYVSITNLGSGGTWSSSLGGSFPGYTGGEFDAALGGVNQHWGTSVGFSNFPNPHPESGVDYIIYEKFSLDPMVMTLPSVVNTTGRITEKFQGLGIGGAVTPNSLFVGDTRDRQGIRSIVQFDTSALPDNAVILKSTIHMTMNLSGTVGNTVGWGPTGKSNFITVKIANPCFNSCVLTSNDWQAKLNVYPVGYMGPIRNKYGYVPIQNFTFTNYKDAINKLGVTEFRFQWSKTTDGDGVADRVAFRSAGQQDAPTITVWYTAP